MNTIQMTIDEPLPDRVDDAARQMGTTRSALIRDALDLRLHQLRLRKLEEQHAAGYARHPVEPGEFDVWDSEQPWKRKMMPGRT